MTAPAKVGEFPSDLPCPMFDGYSVHLYNGLQRAQFENGRTRMRRNFAVEYRTAELTFTLTTFDLGKFQTFANQHGYDWFFIGVPTGYSGLTDPFTPYPRHIVRFISDLEYSALNADTFQLSVTIEFLNGYIPASTIIPSGKWIIAKTPASPASPDWIIARTPSNPATDIVISGSPHYPSALKV